MVNRGNFERYSGYEKIPSDWELVHLGNGSVDEDKLAATMLKLSGGFNTAIC